MNGEICWIEHIMGMKRLSRRTRVVVEGKKYFCSDTDWFSFLGLTGCVQGCHVHVGRLLRRHYCSVPVPLPSLVSHGSLQRSTMDFYDNRQGRMVPRHCPRRLDHPSSDTIRILDDNLRRCLCRSDQLPICYQQSFGSLCRRWRPRVQSCLSYVLGSQLHGYCRTIVHKHPISFRRIDAKSHGI